MWKQLGSIALIIFLGVLLEVSLIYLGRVRGNLGFSLVLKPNGDMF